MVFYIKKYAKYLTRRFFDLYAIFARRSFESIELKAMLAYCSEHVPFYKGKGIDIERYPVINKQIVQDNIGSFSKKSLFVNTGYTSGITGAPGRFLRDVKSMAAEQFYQNRYFRWSGKFHVIIRGERLFAPVSRPDKIWRSVPFIGEMYVSSFHLNDKTMAPAVNKIKAFKNKILWAYPSSAYTLAEYCLRTRADVRFEMVATSSENLLDYQREAIEKAFKCRVYDWYGQAERVAAFYRCAEGRYHEVQGYSYLEVVPLPGGKAKLRGTSMHNRVMPLVRYSLDDVFTVFNEPCPCGKTGITFSAVDGRESDLISTAQGTLSANLLFKHARNIKESQVVQESKDFVKIRVVRNEFFSPADEEALKESIRAYIPQDNWGLEYVDAIARDKSGKFIFVAGRVTRAENGRH